MVKWTITAGTEQDVGERREWGTDGAAQKEMGVWERTRQKQKHAQSGTIMGRSLPAVTASWKPWNLDRQDVLNIHAFYLPSIFWVSLDKRVQTQEDTCKLSVNTVSLIKTGICRHISLKRPVWNFTRIRSAVLQLLVYADADTKRLLGHFRNLSCKCSKKRRRKKGNKNK